MNVELFTKSSYFPVGRHEVEAVSARQAIEFLRAANAETGVHGLVLREEEIAAVAEARRDALLSAGRVDFSGELPAKLACAFCDSPYVSQSEWAELLCGLIALFYDSKNTYDATDTQRRTAYALADDALIVRMRRWFDYPARGSLDCLADLLSGMADRLHFGLDADEPDRRPLLFMGMDADAWLDARPEELLSHSMEEDPSLISHILDHD